MVVLLTSVDGLSTSFAAILARDFPNLIIIRENAVTPHEIDPLRIKRFGRFYVFSEKLTAYAHKFVRLFLRHYLKQRVASLNLPNVLPNTCTEYFVPSINSPACHALLTSIQPNTVAVFNTRILKETTLSSINAPFINYHSGINPKYRGQYPLYWARAAGDDVNCGVTIHLVDKGVDTGDILYQAPIQLSQRDIMSVQFVIPLAKGAELMTKALKDSEAKQLKPFKRNDLPSQLFYPPTVWRYLWNGITKNVW